MIVALKDQRERRGLSQSALASLIGVSRQTLSSIEGGRQNPSVQIAIKLADTLGCRVEDLFRLEVQSEPVAAVLPDAAGATPPSPGVRVALGKVGSAWVAHPLSPIDLDASDGIIVQIDAGRRDRCRVRTHTALQGASHGLLVAGCAPLLRTLGQRLAESYEATRMRWIRASSHRALELLDQGLVHVAGIHLVDEESGQDNASVVGARFADRSMSLMNLVSWEQGLIVPKGNPLGLGPADVYRKGLRVAWREPGAGARALFLRTLGAEGVERGLPPGPTLGGHMDVARAVAAGLADVGVAIEPAASAFDLAFIPLAAERFDLVVQAELMHTPAVARLLEAVDSPGFRAEAASQGGYGTSLTGQLTRVAPDPSPPAASRGIHSKTA